MKRLTALILIASMGACGSESSDNRGSGGSAAGGGDGGGTAGGGSGTAGAAGASGAGASGAAGASGSGAGGGASGTSGSGGVGGAAGMAGSGGSAGATGGAGGSGGDGGPGCAPPSTLCDDVCVDTNQDPRHCGGCNQPCPMGQLCSTGSCGVSCIASQVLCDSRCVDPLTDRAFCGASGDCVGTNAGTVCAAGEVCSMGACAASCGSGLMECAGSCTDVDVDPEHCGGCDSPCTPGDICSGGLCREIVRGWGTPEVISTGNGSSPQVDVIPTGSATAVWVQGSTVRSNRFDAASEAWGTQKPVETLAEFSSFPDLDHDGAGNAVASWRKQNGRAWVSRFDAAADAWGTPDQVSGTPSVIGTPPVQIAVDGPGNIVATFSQTGGSPLDTAAARFDATTLMWSLPTIIESKGNSASRGRIGIDAAGNAIVVFRVETANPDIWAARYDETAGSWIPEVLVGATGAAGNPQVAVDPAGNAVAVWPADSGGRDSLWANRYDATAGTWGTATTIENDNSADAENPQVAIDASGNAIAVWVQGSTVFANRYDAQAASWGVRMRLDPDAAAGGASPQVAMDATGRALVVWRRAQGSSFSIAANSYSAQADQWTGITRVDPDGSGTASLPHVGLDATGRGIAVWIDGTIWANRYQ